MIIIFSAGVVGSPKLLMLSGIGPKEDLARLGIPLVIISSIIIIFTIKVITIMMIIARHIIISSTDIWYISKVSLFHKVADLPVGQNMQSHVGTGEVKT